MLYNGVFGCHGNTCYVIFYWCNFYVLHSVGPINVCTPILTLTLTFDLCSIVCHTHCAWYTGIEFIRIHPVLLGDMPRKQ